MEADPRVQLAVAWPGDLVRVGQAERHEQQAGLVDMPVVLVDDGNLGFTPGQHPTQAISHERAAGPAAEDQNSPHISRMRGSSRYSSED